MLSTNERLPAAAITSSWWNQLQDQCWLNHSLLI